MKVGEILELTVQSGREYGKKTKRHVRTGGGKCQMWCLTKVSKTVVSAAFLLEESRQSWR